MDESALRMLVERSQELGISWRMRTGTVTSVGHTGDKAQVIVDGDTEPIRAQVLIGTVSTDQRVHVIITPPAGNFIIGAVTSTAAAQDFSGDVYWSSATNTVTTSGTSTGNLSGSFTFKAGRAYEVMVGTRCQTNVNGTVIRYRLRVNSSNFYDFGGTNESQDSQTRELNLRGVVRNSTTADITRTVDVSFASSDGGSVSWIGSADSPRYLWLRDCGLATVFTNAPAVS